jgi:predicted esterase
MNRRAFLMAGTIGLLGNPRKSFAQNPAPQDDDIPYGDTRMLLNDEERQAIAFVPKTYRHGSPAPLLLMLHGFGGSALRARSMFPMAEELGIVLLAPESRDVTWGQSSPGFDADSRYISLAMNAVTGFLDIDDTRVGLGGQSDGATYAMSMGLSYGDIFTHLMIFSEGIPIPYRKRGRPRIFIGHGVSDVQMPIDRTSRRFVPQLRSEGYDITYREYSGGHGTPASVIREGFDWFVGKAAVKRP